MIINVDFLKQLLLQKQNKNSLNPVIYKVCQIVEIHRVWPDWAIFCTLGNHSKQVATIILPKSTHIVRQFFKGVNVIHFSSEITFGQLL